MGVLAQEKNFSAVRKCLFHTDDIKTALLVLNNKEGAETDLGCYPLVSSHLLSHFWYALFFNQILCAHIAFVAPQSAHK